MQRYRCKIMKKYLLTFFLLIVLSLASGCNRILDEGELETREIANNEEQTDLNIPLRYPSYYEDFDFQLSKIEISNTDENAAYYEINIYTKMGSFYYFEELTVQVGDFEKISYIRRKITDTEGTAECRYRIMMPNSISESKLVQEGRLIFSKPYNFKLDFDKLDADSGQ